MKRSKLVAVSKTLGMIILFLSFMALFLPFITYAIDKTYLQLNSIDGDYNLSEFQRMSYSFQLPLNEPFVLGIFLFLFTLGISALVLTDEYKQISAVLWTVYGVYLFTYWHMFAFGLKGSSIVIGVLDFQSGRASGEYFFVSRPSLSFIILFSMSLLSIINAIIIQVSNSKKVASPYIKLDQEDEFTTFFITTGIATLILLPFGLGLLFTNTSILYFLWEEFFEIEPVSTTLILLICLSLWIIFLIKFLSLFEFLDKFTKRDSYQKEQFYFLIPVIISVLLLLPRDLLNTEIYVNYKTNTFILPILVLYFFYIVLIYFLIVNRNFIKEIKNNFVDSLEWLKRISEKGKIFSSIILVILLLITIFPFTPFAISNRIHYFPDFQYDRLAYQLEATNASIYNNGTIFIFLKSNLTTSGLFDELQEEQGNFGIRVGACFIALGETKSFKNKINITRVDTMDPNTLIEEDIGSVDIDGEGEEFIYWDIDFHGFTNLKILIDDQLLEEEQLVSLVFCYPADTGEYSPSFGYTHFTVCFAIEDIIIQEI